MTPSGENHAEPIAVTPRTGQATTSRHFAPGRRHDRKRNRLMFFPARNCDLSTRGSIAQIYDAGSGKTDIHWL
jgi:hypothetical protein